MDPKAQKRKYDLGDGIEIGVVIMALIFSFVFLIRINEPVGILSQFQVQNAANLLVSSILIVFVLAMFLGRSENIRSLSDMRPYAIGGGIAAPAAYILAMFEPSAEVAWLCLALGFMAITYLTVYAVRAKEPGAYKFTVGMWIVMVISSASGIHLIKTSDLTGLLLFVALAGTFIWIFGLIEVMNHERPSVDRFGYSASIFCLMMIWLSTSRIASTDLSTGYGEVDGAMAGVGVVFGLLGASVISQRRFMDRQIREAISSGHDAYKDGDYGKAIDSYEKALETTPTSKIARTCKADALAQMKKFDEAIKIYDSVILDDKDYAPAIAGKGSALRQRGELSKSVIYLQKALHIDPGSKIAWNNKGNAFFFLDQLMTAIFCYKKAIEIDPEYSGAWYNLAVSYTNSGKFMEADHAFRTATNLLKRKRPLLKTTKMATDEKSFRNQLADHPGDINLEILTGDLEKRVLSNISFNPGATKLEIMESLNMGKAEASGVLAVLSRSRLVKSKRDGAKLRYYPKEQLPVTIHVVEMEDGSIAERNVKYLTDLQKRIVEEIEANPGISRKELGAKLKLSPQVLKFHLETLTTGKVLSEKRKGLESKYSPKQ